MQRFSINHENEIQALHAESALPEGSTEFHSEGELLQVASNWPAARLVEIWNGLTGVTAVRKFKDRSTAVGRIWKQIQSLTPPPPPEPVKPASTKKATKKAAADAVAPAGEQAAPAAEAAPAPEATPSKKGAGGGDARYG